MLDGVHRDTESLLRSTLYYIRVLLLQPSQESRDVAQRTERHGTILHKAVKECGSTPQSLQDLKEIIDMVGTQNEKIKAI